MKLLLIYPTTISNGKPNKYRKVFIPPLNLAIIDRLTHLASHRHEVKIINEYAEQIDFDADCDLVGITALTAQANRAYQIADQFRAKGKKVILGGVHPSLLPDEALQHADSVAIGEVEDNWSEILADFEAGRYQPIYKSDSFPDLDKLIIPKWDNMDLSVYRRSIGRKMPRMPIFTTRGCVHACDFCTVSKFFGRSYRYKPIDNVLQEIKSINAESYVFTDDNITCNSEYATELFNTIASTIKPNISWFSQASTTLVNKPELISLAAKAGCRNLFFGVESLHTQSLKSINKKFNDPLKYVELYKICMAEGIQPWFSMIFGFDHDTVETVWDTVRFLKKHHIWNTVFWILTPLPATKLYDEMLSSNRIIGRDWSNYNLTQVIFQPTNFSPSRLYDTFWQIYRSMFTANSIMHRSYYSFKTHGFKGLMNSLVTQYYYRGQIVKFDHPYEMGLGKYGNEAL